MQSIDFVILDWIQANMRCPFLDVLMPAVSAAVKAGILWIVIAVVLLLIKKHRKCGLSLLAALGVGALAANVILKNLVCRPRPVWINPNVEMLVRIPQDFSFPSGHSVASFAAATVLMCYDRRFGIPALIFACLIAFSRMYLYVHFPSDVIAGILIGIAAGFFAVWLIRKLSGQMKAKPLTD